MKNCRWSFLVVIFFSACTSQKKITFNESTGLSFLGEYDIPHNKIFRNTTIGGLSGIDYDSEKDVYYLISDDRSSINPARFYTAKIYLKEKGIDSVQFISVNNLLQSNGLVYPNSKQDPYHTPDPEGIRYDRKENRIVWTSEGERIIRKDTSVLENPFIILASVDGSYIDSFLLPANMHMQAIEKGPRQNGVFEGLSFMNDYKKLMVSVEEPLYEDGARAGLGDSSAWIRMIQYDMKTRSPLAQYAYEIDPVAYPATPAGAFKINGIPDILAVNDHQLIVIERSFSTGRKPCTIKVYLAELDGAEDVSKLTSLKKISFHPVKKKLLLNMDDLGIYTDNIEGVTLGPKLPNGRRALLFVADNNFSAEEVTQFLLFEVR